ncbi:MAG TPA: polysaccharide deacetylase family protein [Allosphingosinicella sp.]|jgi:peptidoglycan/xylan/chitin deacetylase (PgdA/CDA1 family)
MNLKQKVLTLANAAGLGAAARRGTRRHLRILCYHGLWMTPGYQFGDCTFIAPEQFAARMERLKRSGLPVLPLGEAVARLGDGTLPDAAVVLTIDDGWVSTFTHMLPILEALGLPATLYATTWYAGRELPVVNVAVDYLCQAAGRRDVDPKAKTAEIEALPVGERLETLRAFGRQMGVGEAWLETRQFHIMSVDHFAEAQRRGLDVQLHTHRHIEIDRRVDELPRELEENRAFLAAALGEAELVHFCHPSGTNHPRARALLAANGIRTATLVTEGLNAPGTDPLALRRFLDGRRVSDVEFDAYLSGLLHWTKSFRRMAA